MEPASKVHNRTPMTCPFCLSPEKILSTHLRRKCMKFNSDEKIKAVLEQAKKTLVNIASKGTILDYQDIMSLGSLDNVVPFLETRGFVVVNKPTVARNVQQEPASRSASSVISLPQCTVNAAEDRDDAIPGQADLEGDLTLFPQSSTEEIEVSETPEDPGENQTDGEEGREYEECTAEVEEEQCEEMENEETPRSGQQKDRSSSVSPVVTLPQCTADAAVELKDAIPGQGEMEAAKEVEDEQSEESETEETFDEETQRALLSKWSTDTRKKMKKAGLYKRHSTREPILMGFSQYLQKSLMVTHYKQEVQDVARFLYYMNAQHASLDFVKDIERANKFFNTLRDMKLANQTIFNYLKHVRRFLTYNLKSTNLFEDNVTLFNSCKFFIEVTEDIQKRLSKGISREVVGKRYQALMSSTKTPRECQRVLHAAKPSFLKCIQNVKHSKVSTKATKLEILYYLEAILVLKHLQRPGVVQNMSVSEWNQRIPNKYKGKNLFVIGVKHHKTSSQQVATFVLDEEEETWFNIYFEKIRPQLTSSCMPDDTFFITTSGKKIYNVSNDIRRLHEKFKVPSISSQLIRRVCETSTLSKFSDSEKCLFARYLSHTNLTAERSYREKTLTDICHGHELVTQTGLYNGDEPIASTSRNQDTTVMQRRHNGSDKPRAATSRNQDAAVEETTDESQEEDGDDTDKEESSHQSGQEEESESDINDETYISSSKKSSHDTLRRSTRQRQTGLQTSTRAVKQKEIISKEKKDSCPTYKLTSKEEYFKRFTKKYPITLEKDVPSPSICREESRSNWRYFGDRWRKIQNKMRVNHITGMLQKNNVKISEVERHIENQGWKRNLPRVTDILHQLKK